MRARSAFGTARCRAATRIDVSVDFATGLRQPSLVHRMANTQPFICFIIGIVKFEVLRDAERLFGASPSLRAQAASSVVEALEGAFEPLALERMLLRHSSTGLPFVIVPGGTFSMGLTERDIAEVHSNFEIASPLCEWLERAVRCASRTRTVEVAPFLCAAEPLAWRGSPAPPRRPTRSVTNKPAPWSPT